MQKGLFLCLLLSLLFGGAFGKEWYEGGTVPSLDASNFSQAVQEPNRFKFVKFFTHNCRYCRLLKQVEDQLLQQQNWDFRIYDVDCSLHYDLCVAAVQPTGFPYIGIYNLKGQLEIKFSGYYPADVMRDVFRNISSRQAAFLKIQGITLENPSPTSSPKQEEVKKQEPVIEVSQPAQPIQPIQPIAVKPDQPVELGDGSPVEKKEAKPEVKEWSSVSQGIKILMVLFGYWMFDKLVRPYLKNQQQVGQFKSKTVQIPLYKSGDRVKGAQEDSLLMSDSL